MKWFETKEIKDREKLTPDQIEYLKKPSIAVLGPFNVIARKHWDIALLWGLVNIISLGLYQNVWCLGLVFGYGDDIVSFLLIAGLNIFGIMHGRRLSWNQSTWKDFESFKQSEKRWIPWAIIILIIWIIPTFFDLISELLYGNPYGLSLGNTSSLCLFKFSYSGF